MRRKSIITVVLLSVLAAGASASVFAAADSYEPDNYYYEANPISVSYTSQSHNFWSQYDEDWVMFFAGENATLKLEAFNCQKNCDPVITLYQASETDWNDLSEIAAVNTAWLGETETLNFTAQWKARLYYARFSQRYGGTCYGTDTGYDMRAVQQTGGWRVLSVRAVNKVNPDNPPPGTRVRIGSGSWYGFTGSKDFTSLDPGTYSVEVIAPGWRPVGNFGDKDDYCYGNPRLVNLPDDGFIFSNYLFQPLSPTPTAAPTPSPTAPLSPSHRRGDYNGDGSTDIAVFRPATGLWAVRGLTRVYHGVSGDRPVPGDYRGAGTTAIAVFRPGNGLWAFRDVSRFYFGMSGDEPVSVDFEGEGTARPGIFRPSSGLWVVRGLTRFYFGMSGDDPVPGGYLGGAR